MWGLVYRSHIYAGIRKKDLMVFQFVVLQMCMHFRLSLFAGSFLKVSDNSKDSDDTAYAQARLILCWSPL